MHILAIHCEISVFQFEFLIPKSALSFSCYCYRLAVIRFEQCADRCRSPNVSPFLNPFPLFSITHKLQLQLCIPQWPIPGHSFTLRPITLLSFMRFLADIRVFHVFYLYPFHIYTVPVLLMNSTGSEMLNVKRQNVPRSFLDLDAI